METAPAKKNIEIYTESNPNPNSLKFVADILLMPEGTVDFADARSAENCPLAKDLFRFNFVKRVFITANFVTVTKSDNMDWIEIAPMIKALVKAYLEEGKPLFKESLPVPIFSEDEPEIVGKIKILLEEYVKPAVEQDGGAINFKSYEDGIVTVILQGSCSGCPSSTITLKAGIENLLKKMIPEIKEVVAEAI